MSIVGSVRGELILKIGDQSLTIDSVSLPLEVVTKPRTDSESPPIALGLLVDFKSVAETVRTIFDQESLPESGDR